MITRNSLADLFERHVENNKDNNVILDFKGIKFISRSCAAEYIKLRERSSKEVSEVNMFKDVEKMFKVILNQLLDNNYKFTKARIIVSS
jgi:anti-anti-sigma regulatory factor